MSRRVTRDYEMAGVYVLCVRGIRASCCVFPCSDQQNRRERGSNRLPTRWTWAAEADGRWPMACSHRDRVALA